jgi:hypothetical protein
VASKLLVTEDRVRQEGDSTDEDSTDEDPSDGEGTKELKVQPKETKGSKRLRLRYAICENCEEEFDVTTNTSKSCLYHPGTPSIHWRWSHAPHVDA